MPTSPTLSLLLHHRWSPGILAHLHRQGGSRFVVLANQLGISRDSLRTTLNSLIEQGFVMRNPGYGHPLRPEYVLTARGKRLAPACARLLKILGKLDIEDIGLRKWSLAAIAVMRHGAVRFNDLKAALDGVTARALAITLKQLENAELVERQVLETYPPATTYRLTRQGRRLLPALMELL